MGNKLSIDGVIFVGSKNIDQGNPFAIDQQGGGIKVDWGSGDVDFLSGSTWIESNTPRARAKASGFNFSKSGCELIEIFADFEPHDSSKDYTIAFSLFNGGQSRCGGQGSQYRILQENGVNINSRIYYQEHTFRGSTVTDSSLFQSVQALFNFEHIPVFQTLIPIRGITSNESGEFSEREQEMPPNVSLLSFGCIVTINYVDGSSSQMTFDECPQNIQLLEDECCPKATRMADAILNELGQGHEL